ncbi:hypothetical protein IHV25_09710 [Phaeovibrio sulfidiphilus]|uniref:Uncharacterized protein n=1 Tax=Phaeovibrio sulfidiphilus TaxID=1220600 RepID=A0A8J6YYE2_9PROT|nr:hypothetical protein [Phaeovibrio sulfidiphilus]MBE1237917.1 hypothetical protein [Phaeovibrio sulfidiphilus]
MRTLLDIFGPVFRFLASLALALALTVALVAALFYRDAACDTLESLTGVSLGCSAPAETPAAE